MQWTSGRQLDFIARDESLVRHTRVADQIDAVAAMPLLVHIIAVQHDITFGGAAQ